MNNKTNSMSMIQIIYKNALKFLTKYSGDR